MYNSFKVPIKKKEKIILVHGQEIHEKKTLKKCHELFDNHTQTRIIKFIKLN